MLKERNNNACLICLSSETAPSEGKVSSKYKAAFERHFQFASAIFELRSTGCWLCPTERERERENMICM